MRHHLKRVFRWGAWSLLLVLCIHSGRAADQTYLEYSSLGGPFFAPCVNGGSSPITGSEIGLVKYFGLRFINHGTQAITIGTVTISDTIGCEVPWNPRTIDFPLNPNGANSDTELGVRPTASTWSFKVTFQVIADTIVTHSHTFGATGIATGSGSQVEVSLPYPTAVLHSQEVSGFNAYLTPIGEPYDFSVRLTNRSALQALNITDPGWTAGTNPSLVHEIENQLPASLSVDQSCVTTFRITALTTTQLSSYFQCLNNDEVAQVFILTQGVVKPKLSVFRDSRQLSCNLTDQHVSASTIGSASTVILTIRNNDTATITYSAVVDSSQTSGCVVATTTSPTNTLAAGQETSWAIAVTPSMTDWEFMPIITVGSASYSRRWRFLNAPGSTVVPPAGGTPTSSRSSSKGGCGLGSGIAALMTFALMGLGGRFVMRRPQTNSR